MCYYQQVTILHTSFLHFQEGYIQLKAFWEAYPNFSLENINIWEMENMLNYQKVPTSIIFGDHKKFVTFFNSCVVHRIQWLWIQRDLQAMGQHYNQCYPRLDLCLQKSICCLLLPTTKQTHISCTSHVTKLLLTFFIAEDHISHKSPNKSPHNYPTNYLSSMWFQIGMSFYIPLQCRNQQVSN